MLNLPLETAFSMTLAREHAPAPEDFTAGWCRSVVVGQTATIWFAAENVANPDEAVESGFVPAWARSILLALRDAGAHGRTAVITFDDRHGDRIDGLDVF